MGQRIAGTCYVKADGDQFEVKGGLEIPLNKITREAVTHVGGVAGTKETIRVPFIKLTAIVGKKFPLKKMQDSDDLTVTAELANGMVYTLSGAFLVGDPDIKAEDAEVDLEFNGITGIHSGAQS